MPVNPNIPPIRSGDPITADHLNKTSGTADATKKEFNERPKRPHKPGMMEVFYARPDTVIDDGRYTAKGFDLSTVNPNSPSGALTADDLGTVDVSSGIEIWYPPEIIGGAAPLDTGDDAQPILLRNLGMKSDGKVVGLAMSSGAGSLRPVRLKNSSGDAGDSMTLCALVYDVYELDNTTLIEESVVVDSSPCRGWPMTVYTPATRGQLYYDPDGTPRIATCNESTANSPCTGS